MVFFKGFVDVTGVVLLFVVLHVFLSVCPSFPLFGVVGAVCDSVD